MPAATRCRNAARLKYREGCRHRRSAALTPPLLPPKALTVVTAVPADAAAGAVAAYCQLHEGSTAAACYVA